MLILNLKQLNLDYRSTCILTSIATCVCWLLSVGLSVSINNLKITYYRYFLLRPWQTRTHCCGHKCFPVCPRPQHLLRTQKMFLILFRNILHQQQMFPSLRSPRKHHGQQRVRNNVSSFTRAFIQLPFQETFAEYDCNAFWEGSLHLAHGKTCWLIQEIFRKSETSSHFPNCDATGVTTLGQ